MLHGMTEVTQAECARTCCPCPCPTALKPKKRSPKRPGGATKKKAAPLDGTEAPRPRLGRGSACVARRRTGGGLEASRHGNLY